MNLKYKHFVDMTQFPKPPDGGGQERMLLAALITMFMLSGTSVAEVSETVESSLDSGASISGTLLPDDIDRRVSIWSSEGGPALETEFLPAGQSEWSVDGLEGGSYFLQFENLQAPWEHVLVDHNGQVWSLSGTNPASGPHLSIAPGEHLTDIDMVLEEGASISGVFVDGDGNPVPAESGPRRGLYELIDDEGRVVGGGGIAESDGELILQPGGGVPEGEYLLRTYSEFRGRGVGYGHWGSADSTTTSGFADGLYPDVPCAGLQCNESAAKPLSLTAGEVTEIEFELNPGGDVFGQVVDDVSGAGIPAAVKLVDFQNNTLAGVITEDDGTFSFGGFPAGAYYLRTAVSWAPPGVVPVQGAYFDRVYGADGDCTQALCDPMEGQLLVLDGESDEGPIELRVNPGPVISGQITNAIDSQVINGGRVDIHDQADNFVGRYWVDTTTSEFQTTALEPGTYTVVPFVSVGFEGVGVEVPDQDKLEMESAPDNAFTVEIDNEDVSIIVKVMDAALDRIFQDAFEQQ